MKSTQGPTMLVSARVKPDTYKALEALAEYFQENLRETVERVILEAAEREGLRK